ncbi:putative DD41D transposase [Trichonephila clavipes]|nr:putative DD41D transposase [Trichonephila clavipes]
MLSKAVLLLHDNARPHTSRTTQERIEFFGWEVLDHAPYSPDFAPSDLRLFLYLKHSLGVKRFSDNEKGKAVVNYWLSNQAAVFFEQDSRLNRFVEWAQSEIAVVPDFHNRILFSDEAHFWLKGYVNKQNCRIWNEANPQVNVETPLHPEKLTVWCALWAGGIIDPYFFKNDEGHNITVNSDGYRAMITNFFIPELNNHDVQELWFQQDGATCHTARVTIDLLKDTFGERLISRFGPVNWPPRSCDLTPLDYFLWGYVKSLVYADKPQTLDHLEDNIRRVIADIRPQMLEKVIENWTSRLDYIRASRGSPMPEIIFKIYRCNGVAVKRTHTHWCAKIKDEGEKLAYQLNEEAERTERPIRRLSKVMYGSTGADMQVDVMEECLSSMKHVVGVRSVFLAKRLHAV